MHTRFLWGNLEQRRCLANLNEDGNMTLKMTKTEVSTCTIMTHDNRHRHKPALALFMTVSVPITTQF
jgi:hypothetical protein